MEGRREVFDRGTDPGTEGETVRDEVEPGERWEFGEEVTDAFDDMLRRSIPQYALMRELVWRVGLPFQSGRHDVVDLGCSRGGALALISEEEPEGWESPKRMVGLEVSRPMAKAARERFAGDPRVEVRRHDLREGVPRDLDPTLILSVLTLQFTPIEHRQRILAACFERLRPGGALILVEKVLGDGAPMDELLTSTYWDTKREAGYTERQIRRKAMSLEGVLVPVTARWNEDMLRKTGFAHVDGFWRCLNFAGWLAVKGA